MKTVSPAPRETTQRRFSRWAAAAALDLGVRPPTVEARVHGAKTAQAECAAVIRRAREFGAHAIAEKVFAPVEAAYAGVEPAPLTPELILLAQEADMAEDVTESAFLADRTPEHRRAWIVALRAQRATALRLLLALEAI